MNAQAELMPLAIEEADTRRDVATRTQSVVPAVSAATTPLQAMQAMFAQGATIEQMKQMMELQQQWEANEARKAYVAAMAKFKLNAPTILKAKGVSFTNRAGDTTAYKHATLWAVCDAALRGLAEVGISHRWIPDQSTPGRISITCVLTHELGHSESTTLAGPEDSSGGKNAIQAIASAKSYLERYTLLAATGLATKDMDTDGIVPPEEPDTIGPGQVLDIEALMSEVSVNRANFLKFCKVERLEDIKLKNYQAVVAALVARRK